MTAPQIRFAPFKIPNTVGKYKPCFEITGIRPQDVISNLTQMLASIPPECRDSAVCVVSHQEADAGTIYYVAVRF